MFEVNKSVDTKTLNAYVAGLWQTKRIVLWDTIIARMDDRELLFVMGHEMGHYVLGHVWQLVALSSLLILVLLYAAYRTMGAIVARWGTPVRVLRHRRRGVAAAAAARHQRVLAGDRAGAARPHTSPRA